MNENSRYIRHGLAFPQSRRLATTIYFLGGYDASLAQKLAIAGMAIAGVPIIFTSYPGRDHPDGHWLERSCDRLVEVLNSDVTLELTDPTNLPRRLGRTPERGGNRWGIVFANDAAAAIEELEPVARSGMGGPVLLSVSGGRGLLVVRFPSAQAALQELHKRQHEPPIQPPMNAEIPLIEAGLINGEIMMGGTDPSDRLDETRLVGFYSLAAKRRRRVQLDPDEDLGELVDEIAQPSAPATVDVFRHQRILLVGCGALGNWGGLAISMDGNVMMKMIDGDSVEIHNLARQPLLVGHLGEAKAPAMAAELAAFVPGIFESQSFYVERPEDLGTPDIDALVCMPDNDQARALAARWAWEHEILYGQAGTGATGGQCCAQEPGRACLECLTGITLGAIDSSPQHTRSADSCARSPDSVVSSNMVLAGLLVSELRQSLAGRRSENLRYHGIGGGGNRLTWQIGDPACPHRISEEQGTQQDPQPAVPR